MKQVIKIISLTLLIGLTLSCQKKNVGMNEEFTLKFNKTAIVKADGKKIEIKFNKLVEESRCQPGVQCVWAGQVAVQIQLDGSSESIIGFHSEYPSSILYKEHTIRLLEVNYDSPSHFGEESHYSLRLKVE